MTLPELRRLLAEADPGPWSTPGHLIISEPRDEVIADAYNECDAALIVALRNHADALLDVVEACREHVSAEDEWGLRYGMGRERVPYREAMEAAKQQLRAALARLDPKETP